MSSPHAATLSFSNSSSDKVLAHANSAELGRYGVKVGLKNYAAAYCTGLLCARRLLDTVGLADVYKGTLTYENDDDDDDDDDDEEYEPQVVKTEYNKRTYFVEELDDDKNPFHALLDVGCITTSTGSRVFGALMGATDGGLDIPHSEKRFPGYDRDSKEYDADVHKERIFGEHVAEYMRYLIEEDATKYKEHFKAWLAEEIEPDDIEEMYQNCHKAIREDPKAKAKAVFDGDKSTYKKTAKKTYEQRKADVEAKRDALMADDDDDDDDEEEEEDDE